MSPTQGSRVIACVRPPAGGAPLRGGDAGEGMPFAGQSAASRSARLSLTHLQSDRVFCVCRDHTPNYRNDLDKSPQQTSINSPSFLQRGVSRASLSKRLLKPPHQGTWTSPASTTYNVVPPRWGTMQFDDLGVIPVIVSLILFKCLQLRVVVKFDN